MPLSEHEQRLLDQIERALYAEDPKFASNVRGARMRGLYHRRRFQGIVLFVLGLLLLVAGVVLTGIRPAGIPVISVLGFLVMFAGAIVAIFSRRGTNDGRNASSDRSSAGQGRSTLAQRMEQRFRRRFEDH